MQGEGADSDWFDWELDNVEAVCELDTGELIRYRKVEPKAPTHEEIMTKWWEFGEAWYQVKCYGKIHKHYKRGYIFDLDGSSFLCEKDWFVNHKSSDIPPEE